ncbi:MAG: threonine aldolase family protein [Actinomycetota bacterium]
MTTDSFVDLRSDTVTTPTEQMRRAMAEAEVGDDCYGEDPTVNRLQDLACEMLGCEAAIYVPTGSMANQIAVKVLSSPGGEVICEQDCHLIHHEAGAIAMLSQVQLRGLPSALGVLSPEDVTAALRPPDPYQPRSVLVAIENTHNAAGGTVWSLTDVEAVAKVAKGAGLPTFCDGARLVNASVATGTSLRDYAAPFDLVTISLYKGLAAPMGSLVCGSEDLIRECWRFRRVFGGALRQAGIVAAAGIIGLESMIDRLSEDHDNAKRLAEGLAAVAPDAIDIGRVHTNMVMVDAAVLGSDAPALIRSLKSEGVLAGPNSPTLVRFVTHQDVDSDGIDRAIEAFVRVLKELS